MAATKPLWAAASHDAVVRELSSAGRFTIGLIAYFRTPSIRKGDGAAPLAFPLDIEVSVEFLKFAKVFGRLAFHRI